MPEILYSDKSIVVINKPAGMLSVPGRSLGMQDSAALRIRKKFHGCIEQPSVHRLDMDTSGLMVFALTVEAHRNLSIQFSNSTIKKTYISVLDGIIDKRLGASGRIELKFRLDIDNRPYQIFDSVNGKTGITLWNKIEEKNDRTRIEFIPHTGRTHQLRLHSAHPVNFMDGLNHGGLGCPVAGDRLYGNSNDDEHAAGIRMLLHASELEFAHPDTGEYLHFFCAAPF